MLREKIETNSVMCHICYVTYDVTGELHICK
jgi:hypothetical protein